MYVSHTDYDNRVFNSGTRFWNSSPTEIVEMHRISSTLKMVFGSDFTVQFCTQHRYVYPNLLGFWPAFLPRKIHQFKIFPWTTLIFPSLCVKAEIFRVISQFEISGDSHQPIENFTLDIQHICGILYCQLYQIFGVQSRNR